MADSRNFLASQKARNAIVGAENLLMNNIAGEHQALPKDLLVKNKYNFIHFPFML